MGKVTGFMEYGRLEEGYQPVNHRLKNYKEFIIGLDDKESAVQAARCMDCGIPFCHHGCPVDNIIPDFNDLVYKGQWKEAWMTLQSTNNFPEFTGRVCPAPCEAACTVNISGDAVGIKSIEHAIIDKAFESGWVQPEKSKQKTGKRVAIVGSGPAGLAAAQQLARQGHSVTVFEKNDRIGGLLRYGIPDFKLDKSHIDQRIAQMEQEGVIFELGVQVGDFPQASKIVNLSKRTLSADFLRKEFDAVLMTCGSEQSRDLLIPGRDLQGIHFAMEFLSQQNRINAEDVVKDHIVATDKHVIVIGGGDTGSDCVGTSRRQGAKSVTQFEVMPMPPEVENRPLTWPYWPLKLRTSSSHQEGCERVFAIATQAFVGAGDTVNMLRTVELDWSSGKHQEVPGSEREFPADLVLLAMGFTNPVASILEAFGVEKDARGSIKASEDTVHGYTTNVEGVFAAGDCRRGQSLVVWAIREGRRAASVIDHYLMAVEVSV